MQLIVYLVSTIYFQFVSGISPVPAPDIVSQWCFIENLHFGNRKWKLVPMYNLRKQHNHQILTWVNVVWENIKKERKNVEYLWKRPCMTNTCEIKQVCNRFWHDEWHSKLYLMTKAKTSQKKSWIIICRMAKKLYKINVW